MSDDCIFCKIVKGEIPCSKVYEDNEVLAFLDIAPANKGHALVIPKEHYETLTDIPEELAAKLLIQIKNVADMVKEATGCEGFNILSNNKPCAGQVVPHLHFHVIPRNSDDKIALSWESKKYEGDEMGELLDKFQSINEENE